MHYYMRHFLYMTEEKLRQLHSVSMTIVNLSKVQIIDQNHTHCGAFAAL